MALSQRIRSRVMRVAHGLMYLIATAAGFYGMFEPASTVARFYGLEANTLLVALVTIGGVLGTYAYAMKLAWLEMVGIPFLATPTALICPALFYGDFSAHQTAWNGWLCAALVLGLIARWQDVRAFRLQRLRRKKG